MPSDPTPDATTVAPTLEQPSPASGEARPETPAREAAEPPAADAGALEAGQLRQQLADKQDRLLRALAEVDNVKRRAQREREEFARFAAETLLRDLLPVLDNLDRALGAAREAAGAARIVEGVELIHRDLLRVLERAGLLRYSALGERFDPARHEAAASTVSATAEPDTVVMELAPGYLLHGRVLRPAQVAVAAPPDQDAA